MASPNRKRILAVSATRWTCCPCDPSTPMCGHARRRWARGPAAHQSLARAPRVFWLMSWSFVVFSLLRFVVRRTRRASEVLRLDLIDIELRYALGLRFQS